MPTNVVSWVLTAKDQTAGAFGSAQSRLSRIGLTSDSVSKKGLAIGAGFIAGGALIAKGIGASIHKAEEFEGAFAKMNRALGATGDTAEKWDDQFRKVYSASPGATLDTVSQSVSLLGRKLKGTEDQIGSVATASHKLAFINQEEVMPVAQALGDAFVKWSIPLDQINQKSDVLASVSQKSGASVSELLNTVNSGQPIFSTLGLSFDQSTVLVGQFARAGIPATRIIAGLQTAGGKLSKEMQEGKRPATDLLTAYQGIFKEIKAAKTPTEALGVAVKDGFSGRTAAQLVTGIRSGVISFKDLDKTLAGTKGGLDATIKGNTTLEGKMASMKRQIDLAKEAIGRGFIPVMFSVVVPLTKWISKIAIFLSQHPQVAKMVAIFSALAAVLLTFGGIAIILMQMKTALVGLKVGVGIVKAFNAAMAASPWILIIAAVALAVYLIIRNWSTIKKWFAAFWKWFQAGWDVILNKTKAIWNAIYSFVSGIVSHVVNFVKEHWRVLLVVLTGPFGLAVALITKYWTQIKEGAAAAWNAITGVVKKAFSPIGNFVKGQLDVVKKWWKQHGEEIKTIVRNFFNAIVGIFRAQIAIMTTVLKAGLAVLGVAWRLAWAIFAPIVRVAIGIVVGIFRTELAILRAILVPVLAILRAAWQVFWTYVQMITTVAWSMIKGAWNVGFAAIKAVALVFWNIIKPIFQQGWNYITLIFRVGWNIITNIFGAGRDIILGIVGAFLDVLTGNFSGAWNTIRDTVTGVVGRIWDVVTKTFNDVKDFLFGLVSSFTTAASNIGHAIIDGIVGAIKGAAGAVKDAVTGVLSKIPGAGILKHASVIGGLFSGAKGGIVNYPASGGVALLHGKEAVLPLNDPARTLAILSHPDVLGTLGRGAFGKALAGSAPTLGAAGGKLLTGDLKNEKWWQTPQDRGLDLNLKQTQAMKAWKDAAAQAAKIPKNLSNTFGAALIKSAAISSWRQFIGMLNPTQLGKVRKFLNPTEDRGLDLNRKQKAAMGEWQRTAKLAAEIPKKAAGSFGAALIKSAAMTSWQKFIGMLNPTQLARVQEYLHPTGLSTQSRVLLNRYKELGAAIKKGTDKQGNMSLGAAALQAVQKQVFTKFVNSLPEDQRKSFAAFLKKAGDDAKKRAGGTGAASGAGGGGGVDNAALQSIAHYTMAIYKTMVQYSTTFVRAVNNLAGRSGTTALGAPPRPVTPRPVVNTSVNLSTTLGSELTAGKSLAAPAEVVAVQTQDRNVAALLEKLIAMPRQVNFDVTSPAPEAAAQSINSRMTSLQQQGQMG